MRKLSLFKDKKEILFFVFFAIFLFLFHIFVRYESYKEFSRKKFYHTGATVLSHYQKQKASGGIYHVLKLRSDDGAVFYTTNHEDLIDLSGRRISLSLITHKISFFDYLRLFFVPSYDIRIDEKLDTFKEEIAETIASQHQNQMTKELFLALFLAEPISKELRSEVAKLGISHLIAISGFHLGVLFALIYFILNYPYSFLQDRYFPYRNKRTDLTITILVILFSYLYLLDFVPSLLRSFVMLFYGFFLFHRHFKIVSFEVLFITVLTVLAIFPTFLFSIGFWFSVSGVFYIYLFLHHFGHFRKWLIVVLLNVWVYMLMIPIVHLFFDTFSFHQLYSPLLSIVFSIFYPFEIFLHLIGEGDLLDGYILTLLNQKAQIYHFKTPLWYLLPYLILSVFAIFEKRALWLLLPMSVGVYFI